MELSNEQIQKLDNFLEGIGMEYMDIRIEILDHIASEIEETIVDRPSFFADKRLHTVFLKYMLSRQSELKNRYARIVAERKRVHFKTMLYEIWQESIKPFPILFLLALIVGYQYTLGLSKIFTYSFVFLAYAVISTFHYYNFRKPLQKYGNFVILESYESFSTKLILPMCFLSPIGSAFIPSIKDNSYSLSFLLLAILTYLLNLGFKRRKNAFLEKYKTII